MLMTALLCVTLSGADVDSPVDALHPVNRTELRHVLDRLERLEQEFQAREERYQSKISHLERSLHELREQQPINRRFTHDTSPGIRWGGRPQGGWVVQWMETAVRWLPNGDWAWQPSEPIGHWDPVPYEVRSKFNPFSSWIEKEPYLVPDPNGNFYLDYWIAPGWSPRNPFDGGFLLGANFHRAPPAEPHFLETIEECLRTHYHLDEYPSFVRRSY